MPNILELLKNEKVEWKKLGEVFDTRTGYTPSKKIKEYWGNGTVDWFTIEDIRKKGRNLNAANVKISEKAVKKELFKKNSLILSIIGTIGEYALIDIDFVVNQQFMVFTPNNCYKELINMEYIKYYFSKISEYCKNNTRQSSVPTVDTDAVLRQEIPIPSLETQEKIVEILDKFTNYVTELLSELQSRTKQYTYYRDKLLSEEYLNKVTKEMEEDRKLNIFKLDEIFDFKNGLNKGKEFFGKGVPFISYVNVYKLDRLHEQDIIEKVELTQDEIERFRVVKGDVLFTRTSEVKEEVGYSSVVMEDLNNTVFNGFTIRARLKNSDLLLPEYSAHLFRCHEIRKEIIRRSSFTTRASLSGQELGKVKVVIPPLSLQNKIVKVLDKFQVLLADTKGLLPAEIEERQKQYEYYREKLLTFDVECSSTHARTHVDNI